MAAPDDARREYDRQRDKRAWRGWYKTVAWQQKREEQLAAEPLCAFCRKAGRLTPATVADHVHRHYGDYEKFWNGPLQSLCDQRPWRCHSSTKQRQEKGGLSR
jgi:hypothetical protein